MTAKKIRPDNPNLLNQVETAKLLGIKPPALNRYCRVKFKPALVGKFINIKHPLIIEYMEGRAGRQAAIGEPPPPYIGSKENLQDIKEEGDEFKPEHPLKVGSVSFDKIENLTIKEVVQLHGTMAGFKNYLDALKTMAIWKNNELKFLEARSQLVEMNPFVDTIFKLIDLTYKRIVGEFPGSIASQLQAIMKGGKENVLIEMKSLMEKELSQILKSCKTKIVKDINKKKKQATILYV